MLVNDDPWQPGPRPAWVRSLHAALRPEWIRLDADELLDAAQRHTGLGDFGGDEFLAPYRIFVRACETEAKLHGLGRMLVRGDVSTWLENRLRLTDARKRDPRIAAQRIERPIFITGLPRTGTTLLHELFMQDPENRVPLHWEVRSPHPAPETATYATDPRIAQAEDELQLWNHIVPEYRAMHELGARIPVEDIQITPPSFVSDELMGRHMVPSYAAWYAGADKTVAFAFHRRFLQHLQSRHARARWVLKSPSWLGLLPVLFGALGREHPLLDRVGAQRRRRRGDVQGLVLARDVPRAARRDVRVSRFGRDPGGTAVRRALRRPRARSRRCGRARLRALRTRVRAGAGRTHPRLCRAQAAREARRPQLRLRRARPRRARRARALPRLSGALRRSVRGMTSWPRATT
jgi:hypothetical protein